MMNTWPGVWMWLAGFLVVLVLGAGVLTAAAEPRDTDGAGEGAGPIVVQAASAGSRRAGSRSRPEARHRPALVREAVLFFTPGLTSSQLWTCRPGGVAARPAGFGSPALRPLLHTAARICTG